MSLSVTEFLLCFRSGHGQSGVAAATAWSARPLQRDDDAAGAEQYEASTAGGDVAQEITSQ